MDGLKEQLMIRTGEGKNLNLSLPTTLREAVDPYFIAADRICRSVVPVSAVEGCLDPDPLPAGYPSSPILDCFNYYGRNIGGERFHNNHAAHTDSGTLTLVVCSDEPGLEVYDEKEKCWLAIEKIVHKFAKKNSRSNREFACVFWGDSVATLEKHVTISKNGKKLGNACLHRVAACGGKERVSVVYKQRSAPLKTFPRYQEDYLLAAVQYEATKKEDEERRVNWNSWGTMVAMSVSAAVLLGTLLYGRQRISL